MANVQNPNGFSPIKSITGATYNGATSVYYIPSTDNNAYYVGDPVKSLAGGDANGIPGIVRAAAGNTIRGVITAVDVTPPNQAVSFAGPALPLELWSIPATKTRDYYVEVCDDPNALFEIQDDGASALTSTSCNKNANFIIASPTSPQQASAVTLNSATVNTTQAFSLRIIGLVQRANNAYGTYARWAVKINQHELMGNTAGV